jgi:hypothetical protein
MTYWNPLVWLVATLLILLVIKTWITRYTQVVGLLLFGSERLALGLYFLVFFPGIVLHEFSHYVAALLLGVRVGRLSIGPKSLSQGRVQFGSVEIARSDPLRESIIGLAPLLTGSLAILLIATLEFGLRAAHPLQPEQIAADLLASWSTYAMVPDFWLWLYLIFAVSNAMLPSESDRRPWVPLLLFLILVGGALYIVGWAPKVPDTAVAWVLARAEDLAFAFGLTIVVDVIFGAAMFVLGMILERVRGRRMEY